MNRYCLLIPSYQHSQQLKRMIPELRKINLPCIIVNDGSDYEHSQQLRDLARRHPWVILIEHDENQGKGRAVISGLFAAFEKGFSHAVQVDSDNQHDLSKIYEILKESKQNPEKLISGCAVYNESAPMSRKWGRYITHIWVWIETLSFKIVDSMCGFRVYPLKSTCSVLKKSYVGRGMDFDTEIMVKLFWQFVDIKFVPVQVNYPKDGVSHFNILRDNWLISKMHTRLFFGMILRFPLLILKRKKRRPLSNHWSSINEKGMILGIQFVFLIYKVFGRKICSYLLKIICFYYWLFALKAREASSKYIKTYRNYAIKNKWKIHKISTFSHIYNFSLSILDKFSVWKGDYTRNDIKSPDKDLLKELSKKPQGALFIGSHFGNMEIARAVGRENLNKVYNALVYTENAVKFNHCLESINGDSSLNMIEVRNFDVELSVRLKEKIQQGEWLFIVGDRTSVSATRSLSLDFLGKPAEFPLGPFLLGYLLGAPVYSFFCYKEDKSFRISFKNILPNKPYTSTSENKINYNKMSYIEAIAENYIKELEEIVRIDPKQWFNFFKFWRDL